MPPSSRVLRPDNSGGKPTCPNDWGELGGRLSVAVANSRRSKPSDARSTATDLVINTSRGVRAEGAGSPWTPPSAMLPAGFLRPLVAEDD